MNKLSYSYGTTDNSTYIAVLKPNPGMSCYVKFHQIHWNMIEMVHIYIDCVSKEIYTFMLKLPKLKRLRFKSVYGLSYLVTYDLRFFKHKSLLMYNVKWQYGIIYYTSVIFIL